jgi:hypothetical protein
MATLPQPTTLHCEDKGCGDPIDFLFSSWSDLADPDDLDEDLWLLRCPKHKTHQWGDAQGWVDYHRRMRWEIGNPPGTLLVIEERIGDQNARGSSGDALRRFPSLLYGVDVDSWDPAWPQVVIPSAITQGGLVILGAVVTLDQLRGPGWVFRWSWQQPERQASCELVGWDAPMKVTAARTLMDALGAFREFQGPGRPLGSGAFETPQDLESAVFRTVCALIKKSRKPSYKPSYKEIGRALGIHHRPAGREPLRDSGRSFTLLCERHELNARELVDRAIVACASGE